jgi:hypothetical protein
MAKNDTSKDTSGPLLMDELSVAEKIVLGQLTHQPGFTVLQKLFDAACTRATADIVKLDPEEEGYDRVLAVRSQRARTMNEFANSIRKSVLFHTQTVITEAQEDDQQAVDLVAKTFGIHKVTKKKLETPAV